MENEPISIEKQFENYCKRVKIYKEQVSETQWIETKRSFFGGAASMLVLMRGPIPDLPEEMAEAAFEKLWQESLFFWQAQRSQ